MNFIEIKKELDKNINLYIEFDTEYYGDFSMAVCRCKICRIEYSSYWNKMVLDRMKSHVLRKHKGQLIAELMKPWEDKDSLFCSPILAEIIGKEPRQGIECKDNANDA